MLTHSQGFVLLFCCICICIWGTIALEFQLKDTLNLQKSNVHQTQDRRRNFKIGVHLEGSKEEIGNLVGYNIGVYNQGEAFDEGRSSSLASFSQEQLPSYRRRMLQEEQSPSNQPKTSNYFNQMLEIAIVITAAILCTLAGALFGFYAQRINQLHKDKVLAEQKLEAKVLKHLMTGLVSWTGPSDLNVFSLFAQLQDICFVITDIEESTSISKSDPVAFVKLQEIHDQIFRENVAKHGGYEIITEGDSFHIAFTSVVKAVLFCMETQYRLLETDWPRQILQLAPCKTVLSADKMSAIFRGPRVRMGIHWAAQHSVATRLHQLTRHRVFEGPGLQIAKELGNAAYGGQVLLSEEAWQQLRGQMGAAGFPVIEQIGMFQMSSEANPVWVYNVRELLGKPLDRKFGIPRGLFQVQKGLGLSIIEPPNTEEGPLVFVALRLDHEVQNKQLPTQFAEKLFEVVMIQAQYFGGFLFQLEKNQGQFMLCFEEGVDAVRFCHALQAVTMYTAWPKEGLPFFSKTEMSQDRGNFKGPGVAMAIHETDQYEISYPSLQINRENIVCQSYGGDGPNFCKQLCSVTYGGQVVLSEPCWMSVSDSLPGQPQTISLGEHRVSSESPAVDMPMLLMEVLPSALRQRSFPEPKTFQVITPGYRQSPSPDGNMAIVFAQVQKPQAVLDIERGDSNLPAEEIHEIMTAYRLSVSMTVDLVRKSLYKFQGYECKEPDPGKFTLAFKDMPNAIKWCCYVQRALLVQDWPQALLGLNGCLEQWNQDTRRLIWRGLRMRMGMAYGQPSARKPLNTGRADYFGVLPNLAARVMALASPGQILLEGGNEALQDMGIQWISNQNQQLGIIQYHKQDSKGTSKQRSLDQATPEPSLPSNLSEHPSAATYIEMVQLPSFAHTSTSSISHENTIEIRHIGSFLLKGLDNPQSIYQAILTSLVGREFSIPQEAVLVSSHTSSGSGVRGWFSNLRPPSGTLRRAITYTSQDPSNHGFKHSLSWTPWDNKDKQSSSGNLGTRLSSILTHPLPASYNRRFSSLATYPHNFQFGMGHSRAQSPSYLSSIRKDHFGSEEIEVKFSEQEKQQQVDKQRLVQQQRQMRHGDEVQLFMEMRQRSAKQMAKKTRYHMRKSSSFSKKVAGLVERSHSSSSSEGFMGLPSSGNISRKMAQQLAFKTTQSVPHLTSRFAGEAIAEVAEVSSANTGTPRQQVPMVSTGHTGQDSPNHAREVANLYALRNKFSSRQLYQSSSYPGHKSSDSSGVKSDLQTTASTSFGRWEAMKAVDHQDRIENRAGANISLARFHTDLEETYQKKDAKGGVDSFLSEIQPYQKKDAEGGVDSFRSEIQPAQDDKNQMQGYLQYQKTRSPIQEKKGWLQQRGWNLYKKGQKQTQKEVHHEISYDLEVGGVK